MMETPKEIMIDQQWNNNDRMIRILGWRVDARATKRKSIVVFCLARRTEQIGFRVRLEGGVANIFGAKFRTARVSARRSPPGRNAKSQQQWQQRSYHTVIHYFIDTSIINTYRYRYQHDDVPTRGQSGTRRSRSSWLSGLWARCWWVSRWELRRLEGSIVQL